MKDIKVLRDNARAKVEELNNAVATEDEKLIATAKSAAENALGAVNAAIIENDYEAFKNAAVPASALISQCFHNLDRIKASKVKGTQRTLYAYDVEGSVVEISLKDAAENNVIDNGYALPLKKLYELFAGRVEIAITNGSTANLDKAPAKGREADPLSKSSMTKALQVTFDALLPTLKARSVDVEFMKRHSTVFTRGVANSLDTVGAKVREQALIRAAHTILTDKVYILNRTGK